MDNLTPKQQKDVYDKAYAKGQPIISDFEYDQFLKKHNLEDNNPNKEEITKGKKHNVWMPSIEKRYTIEDIEKFIKNNETICSYKLDGSSCSLYYSTRGLLTKALTRGSGFEGNDITKKVKIILEKYKLNNTLLKSTILWSEVVISKTNYELLKSEMKSRGLDQPSSIRNVVAGLLNRGDNDDLCKYLDIVIHNVPSLTTTNLKDKFDIAKNIGFLIPKYEIVKNIKTTISNYIENKLNYLFETDGLVFTYNDSILCNNFENKTSHHYKWNCCYKLEDQKYTTKVKDIIYQVGRTGHITPVAILDKVDINGVQVSQCTLHNINMIKSNNITIGSTISIIRSNDVIPKFINMEIENNNSDLNIPSSCPECSSNLKWNETRISLYCTNDNCIGRLVPKINHFCKSLGIKDVSESRIRTFIKYDLVSDIEDMYSIDESIRYIDGLGSKIGKNIREQFENKKSIYLNEFIKSLGLNLIGNKVSNIIAENITVEQILTAHTDTIINKIQDIEGIGNKIIESLKYQLKTIISYIDKFDAIGVKILDLSDKEETENNGGLSGLSFILSGSFENYKKGDYQKMIFEAGGKIESTVKRSDILVSNETTTKKCKDASKYGKEVWSEQKLNEKLGL